MGVIAPPVNGATTASTVFDEIGLLSSIARGDGCSSSPRTTKGCISTTTAEVSGAGGGGEVLKVGCRGCVGDSTTVTLDVPKALPEELAVAALRMEEEDDNDRPWLMVVVVVPRVPCEICSGVICKVDRRRFTEPPCCC